METTIKHFSKKAIPFIILSLIVGVLGGSFFGRHNTITCDKKSNTCKIESKGYLYTVYTEEIAMNEIISTHVQKVTDKAPENSIGKKKRPDLNYYSLIIERGMEKPLKVIPNAEVPVHDIFNYAIPIFEVSDAFNAYLANPDQNEATFTFGTYRTGIVFTLTIFGFLAFWFYYRNNWTLSYSSKKDRVTKDFLDNSGNEEFIDRTAYNINIKRGKSDAYNGLIYLLEGSSILFENGHLKVKHSYKKKPEKAGSSEIPKGLPYSFQELIMNLKA
jgi:hypothetical protein